MSITAAVIFTIFLIWIITSILLIPVILFLGANGRQDAANRPDRPDTFRSADRIRNEGDNLHQATNRTHLRLVNF